MGLPLSSAATLSIVRLGRALPVCLPRGLFSHHRAALGAARRPTLPVVRPVARGVAVPITRPEAHGGFVTRGARARPHPPHRPSRCLRGPAWPQFPSPVEATRGGGPRTAPPVPVATSSRPRPGPAPSLVTARPRPCPAAAPAAALLCVRVWVWQVGGGGCVDSPAPPPPLSPTAAATAEGGGCVGDNGVVLGGGV
ncbi:unnamed protein product [Closterium sp. NIES-54]